MQENEGVWLLYQHVSKGLMKTEIDVDGEFDQSKLTVVWETYGPCEDIELVPCVIYDGEEYHFEEEGDGEVRIIG
nr:hypothetical protein 11 [bacterium]